MLQTNGSTGKYSQLWPRTSAANIGAAVLTRTHSPVDCHVMNDQGQSPHFRSLFESALHDYQRQTGTTLANHPLAEQIRSVESITAVLYEQARAFSEFKGDDGRIMDSLQSVVSILCAVSASTALGKVIGSVRWRELIDVSISLTGHSKAIPTRECSLCWLRHPTSCMSFSLIHALCPCDTELLEAFKHAGTSSDATVNLLESIEHFVNRLDIYTKVPPTVTMTENVVKIFAELISTLALATKETHQKRPSKCIRVDTSLDGCCAAI
jgi:hypothetical protein